MLLGEMDQFLVDCKNLPKSSSFQYKVFISLFYHHLSKDTYLSLVNLSVDFLLLLSLNHLCDLMKNCCNQLNTKY